MPLRLVTFMGLLGQLRARHALIACGLVIGLVLALATALLIIQSRRNDIANAERELKNLSLVLAEETDQAFQSMELVQIGLIQQLREQGIDTPEKFDGELTSRAVQQDLQRRIADRPQISGLRLVSRSGRMLNLSGIWPLPNIDLRDRDYFLALSRDPTLVSFIGAPVQSRADGQLTILFARAYRGADGQLIGIVSAGLHLALFEHRFARITVAGDGSFALFRSDGVLLARYPRVDADIGRTYGATGQFRSLPALLDRAVVIRGSMFDGKSRLIAPHSVAHYPLILSATNTEAAVLQAWRVRARLAAGVVAFAELILAGVVWLGIRQLRGQERLIAADAAAMHAEAARALAESELGLAREREAIQHAAHMQSQRFDVALGNMVQGLMMVDGTGRLLVVNPRFIELFGLPADTVLQIATYAEVADLVVTCGTVTAENMAAMQAWRRDAVANRAGANFTWELANGRTLKITHRTMPDGSLTTYEDITESRRADLRMAYMARHDALTDLPNRVLFHENLEAALAHARRGQKLALHCLDLDQFKAVNDTLGHPVGDALLQAVAARLLERTRETETVARLGGDEFAVVQTPIERPAEAADFAERLIAMLEEPFDVAGHRIVIGTSIGIAFAPQDGLDADQLLKSADLAMYRAKSEGRGVYRLFQAGMDAEMQARRAMELDLRGALRDGQFELFYQPLINLRARAVGGFEALLRWRHPARGLVPPDQFIPLAEEIGAIVPIGEWVLRRACAVATTWPDGMKVAVNLSPVQFKSRGLVGMVAAALRDSGLAPGRLELEITETVLLQDTAATLATLHDIRALGVHIAMDDFGTGYSSLSYLRRFPFDRIKIDQSFVRELGKTRDSSAIVRAVTALGRELGMATTAEGVETHAQLAALARAGCTDVQGYLFSRPVPETAIAALLCAMDGIEDLLRPEPARAEPVRAEPVPAEPARAEPTRAEPDRAEPARADERADLLAELLPAL